MTSGRRSAHGKSILFLTDNFPPEVNAPASRTYEHAREWVRAGHNVTVITCVPNYPGGVVFAGYKNRLWQVDDIEGIRVVRVWTYISANRGVFRRTVDYLSFMVSAAIASVFVQKPDVVIATSPQFFTACAGLAASRLRRVPFIFELRDLWPESIEAVDAMSAKPVLRLLRWIEHYLYKKAHAIVSVTHSFRSVLIDRGIRADKIHVVTNGVDRLRYAARTPNRALLQKLGCDGKFVAGYIGTHGLAHALETILNAAHIVQSTPSGRGIAFILLGDGAKKPELRSTASSMGLKNLIFIDTVTKEEVVEFWSILDVAIVHLKKTALFSTVIPSKIFEAFAMEVPVVLGLHGESRNIIEGLGSGFCFEPEDAEELAQLILWLASQPDQLKAARAGCASGATQYDRRQLAEDMLTIVLKVVTESRGT